MAGGYGKTVGADGGAVSGKTVRIMLRRDRRLREIETACFAALEINTGSIVY
jgi:hypothetical protein